MGQARSVARLLCAGLLVSVLASAGQANAQDKPRPRPKPLPEASDMAASNSLSDQNSLGAPDAAIRPPVPSTRTLKPVKPIVAPPPPLVLRSAVHSRYSRLPTLARSTTGQCRAQCAVARTQCASGGEADTSGCDPAWTQCLSTCDGLTYSRGP
ncbi:hypothetical protein [Caulobacter sp. S45]|uniref:hypothetical protein n=1 Tax=Caulobacter sp. S45 TaxID=1641861 RepID=UPI001C2D1D68|nr:hypothetical protein [Caulobacter sp. S45]